MAEPGEVPGAEVGLGSNFDRLSNLDFGSRR